MDDDRMAITGAKGLYADIVSVAQWAADNGLSGHTLIRINDEIRDNAPKDVLDAIDRIDHADVESIASPNDYSLFFTREDLDQIGDPDISEHSAGYSEDHADAALAADMAREETVPGELRPLITLLESFDYRDLDILSARLLADDPETLNDVGARHGITRERVRQIERDLKARMINVIEQSDLPSQLRHLFRHEGEILPRSKAFENMPVLVRTLPLLNVPIWRLLQALGTEPSFEIADGWMATPSLDEAKRCVNEVLSADANEFGVVRIGGNASHANSDQIDDSARNLQAWLKYCGMIVMDDFAFVSCRSLEDFAVASLFVKDRPLTLDEIINMDPKRRSVTSLRNALARDDRVNRVSKDKYGLVDWGMPEYSNIRGEIQRILDRNGGSVELNRLIREIAGRSGASERSIVSYAGTLPFRTVRGVVTMADPGRMKADNDPYASARLFRHSDAWLLRTTLTHEHERGSGSVLPMSVANILGLEFRDERELHSPLGVQRVYWTGISPGLGTVKRFFDRRGLAVGQQVFLRFGDDGTFDIVPMADLNSAAMHDALVLCGGDGGDADSPQLAFETIARSIGLTGHASSGEIIEKLLDRGDEDIAELLPTGNPIN
ncbi:sigma factor-like helix-turn-helix DNA-binding protein [Bifidobacterium simiarum]|uniref:sigma factor-like helix-turn-helix DNA-binding protein n=1 Tax=Bifidobacterium simiarum TaxID=2045441 RepID=UPI001BDC80D3|nr:hypothetical protein [Bifidobacterium simiarum]